MHCNTSNRVHLLSGFLQCQLTRLCLQLLLLLCVPQSSNILDNGNNTFKLMLLTIEWDRTHQAHPFFGWRNTTHNFHIVDRFPTQSPCNRPVFSRQRAACFCETRGWCFRTISDKERMMFALHLLSLSIALNDFSRLIMNRYDRRYDIQNSFLASTL